VHLPTWSRIGHRKQERLFMFEREVLVIEFLAIYRFASGAVECRKVSALNHETFDDPVKD